MLRYAFQIILEEEFDDKLIISYESPVFEDKEFILKVARTMPAARTIDEWRAWQGLEPLEDDKGKAVVMISGYAWVPTSQLGGEIVYTTPNLKDGDTVQKFEDEDEDDDDSFSHKAKSGRDPPPMSERTLPERVVARLDKEYGDQLTEFVVIAVTVARNKLNMSRITWLLEAGDVGSVLREVASALGSMNVEDLIGTLREAMQEAGDQYAKYIDSTLGVYVPFSADGSDVAQWLFNHEAELRDQLVSASQNGVKKAISEGKKRGLRDASIAILIGTMFGLTQKEFGTLRDAVYSWEEEGLSDDEIEKRASQKASELLTERAKFIARDQIGLANGWALEFAYRNAAGTGRLAVNDYQRMWVVTWDDRLCPYCAAMAGELSPIGGMWATPLGSVSVPNQIHPACRCTYMLVRQ
jgi:hypothetical protein